MGQPDPRWAEAPEFNWIPDKPFRAEFSATANSNEPPPVVAVREESAGPVPARAKLRTAPRLELRRILKRHADSWANGGKQGAAFLRRPAQPVAHPPPLRMEPRFDLQPFLEREAAEWTARTDQGATLFYT